MVRSRRGRSRLGCLASLLVVVVAAAFAYNIGEAYLRFYRFRDAMSQEARFADTRSDTAITTRLVAVADSLGLPEEAGRIRIRRDARRLVISSRYSVLIELPMFARLFHFSPEVVRTF